LYVRANDYWSLLPNKRYAFHVRERSSQRLNEIKGGKPRLHLNLAIEDAGYRISCAMKPGTRLKAMEIALRRLIEAKKWADDESARRSLDSSSLYGALRRMAGLEFESDAVREGDV
jgi:hypothetical protein